MRQRLRYYSTATKQKLAIFLFWTAKKQIMYHINRILKEKLIETITSTILYLRLKENNENDMAATPGYKFR